MTANWSRRKFLAATGAAGAASTVAGLAPQVMAQSAPKVVVIGGGAGGATVARYLAKDSEGALDVTLVEPNRTYTTCFFSNWYLGGFRSYESITHSYATLAEQYGIAVVPDFATGIDLDAQEVSTATGLTLKYDRLVVAPGIDFKWGAIEGYDEAAAQVMPHAYKAGPQTRLLRHQLLDMEDGGTFLMVAPPNPYRCPPGPYERVSMVAHYFKAYKPRSKIVIIDPKGKHSKQGLFQEGWNRHFPGMIEWIPGEMTGGGARAVNLSDMAVMTEDETFEGNVINVIPAQYAGGVARDAGLADDSGWCPIDPFTLASKQAPNVHLVGDAIIPGDMPKSGFSANSQAKACALAIRAALTDAKQFPPRFRNTCWSLITTDDAVKVGASYEATEEKIAKTSGFISETGESDEVRAQTADEAIAWYNSITKDMFG